MKFTWLKWSALPMAVLMMGTAAMAQDQTAAQGSSSPAPATQTATPAAKPDPSIAQRKENQQDRIANGVKSGQLTAGETAKLENQQKGINQQVKADRAANGGKLTAGEKAQVNHEQNRASRNVYRKKHNGRTQGGAKPK
ncbi:MAG: hypothetical protein ACYDCG_19495 [Candidatus Acidiferrales bacterium]